MSNSNVPSLEGVPSSKLTAHGLAVDYRFWAYIGFEFIFGMLFYRFSLIYVTCELTDLIVAVRYLRVPIIIGPPPNRFRVSPKIEDLLPLSSFIALSSPSHPFSRACSSSTYSGPS